MALACMPAWAAMPEGCPWLNAATAAGVLGGETRTAVTATSCEFEHRAGNHEIRLRIEVKPSSASHEQCPPGGAPLKGIGNEATACSYRGKPGWIAEQVTGRVRDRAFLVRIATDDRSRSPQGLREQARNIAEEVAGILY